MKPYVKDKDLNSPKFRADKFNKKFGVTTKTKSSKDETDNANRSRKKGVRQKSKKIIKEDIDSFPDQQEILQDRYLCDYPYLD